VELFHPRLVGPERFGGSGAPGACAALLPGHVTLSRQSTACHGMRIAFEMRA